MKQRRKRKSPQAPRKAASKKPRKERLRCVASGDEIPEFLRKKGITRLMDNLPPGSTLDIADITMLFFKDELLEALSSSQNLEDKDSD